MIMAVEPRRLKEYKFKKPVKGPVIQVKDLPVHRFINSNNGLARIRRLKFMLGQTLEHGAESMPYRKRYKALLEILSNIEQEFNGIRTTNEVPLQFDLRARMITLAAINDELIKRKVVHD
jgi:hypothetical protein